jgi:nitroreductase
MDVTLPPLVDADSLFAAIFHRRSMGLSKLRPDPVDRRLIERMLEAANWAPSHHDTEPWRFGVFAGDGRSVLADLFGEAYRANSSIDFKQEAYEASRQRAYAAPVWISIGMAQVLREDGALLRSESEELMAVAGAALNLHLMASAQGLAGMWHSKGLSVDPYVAEGLGLVRPSRLLGFFMCGWPSGEWMPGSRRPISEKVTWFE